MLGGKQHFIAVDRRYKGRVTRFPRGALDTGARAHLHSYHVQRHAQGRADRTTMVRPRLSYSLEAVMHMNSAQRGQGLALRKGYEQVQQDGGVEAAGEGDAPGGGVAPGEHVFEEPGWQINRGLIHRNCLHTNQMWERACSR
ncbi:hypothetical protein EMIT0P228_100286 [Pseudomonas brassicacearum]|nr:hypothetical protein GCM10020185_16410 [Pseudomonas brassicacearum subsp. brassicacearum]